MDLLQPMQKKYSRIILYALAFLIPCLCLCIAMWEINVFPFGEKSVLIWDLNLQHKDYYSYLWDALHGNESFQYSFSKSLGGRMIGILAFYVSSLSNICLLLFEKAKIVEYLSYMTIIKIAFSGVTCAYFLNNCFKNKGYVILCMSTSYALMEYNVCYCRNPMWLDGVIFLPLVCLGVHKIIKGQSGCLLWITTALTIICNWYTGYMVCLMSSIYFIFELFFLENIDIREVKTILNNAGRYVLYLLLGVMVSGIVLFPACFSLIGGKATFNFLNFAKNMSLLQTLNGFSINAAYNKHSAPILYCGGFLLIVVIYGLVNRRISIKRKIGYGLLLGILLSSFVYKNVELMWTAYVESFSYYFRFAFIGGFIMVLIASDIFAELEKRKKESKETLIYVLITIGLAFIILIGEGKTKLQYIYALGVSIYGVLLIIYCRIKKNVWIPFLGIIVILMGELTYNAQMMFKEYKIGVQTYENYVNYMANIIDEIKGYDEDPYRIEKTYNFIRLTSNRAVAAGESLMFNYMSIENYSSAYDKIVDNFIANLGYSDYPTKSLPLMKNRRSLNDLSCETYWHSSMLPGDAFLGIKYVIDKKRPYGYELLKMNNDLPKGWQLYKNKYVLPLAFNVSDNYDNVSYGSDPYENQNRLYSAVLGEGYKEIYTKVGKKYRNNKNPQIETWNLKILKSGPVYVFIDGSEIHENLYKNNCELMVNNRKLQDICKRFDINSVYIGDYDEGTEVTVSIKHHTERGNHNIYVGQLNKEVFEDCINKLRKNNGIKNLIISEDRLTAKYFSEKPSNILFTIPYDKGWTVKIDNKEVSYYKFGDALIVIPVDGGKHTIDMQYTTPGIREGAIFSLIGILGFGFISVRKIKNKQN